MQLRVQFQGQLRNAVGMSERLVDLPDESTLRTLLTQLSGDYGPEVSRQLLTSSGEVQPCLLIARNGIAVPRTQAATTLLSAGDVVVLLPPIAGG